jgi:hypothetical protein
MPEKRDFIGAIWRSVPFIIMAEFHHSSAAPGDEWTLRKIRDDRHRSRA